VEEGGARCQAGPEHQREWDGARLPVRGRGKQCGVRLGRGEGERSGPRGRKLGCRLGEGVGPRPPSHQAEGRAGRGFFFFFQNIFQIEFFVQIISNQKQQA